MPSVVIVTSRCYLLCEAINHISVNEIEDDCKQEAIFSRSSKKKRKKKRPTKAQIAKRIQNAAYEVVINFIPHSKSQQNATSSRNHDETETVSITVHGRDRCLALFSEIVQQIREQLPDQMFLDKLVEQLMNNAGSEAI